MARTVKIANIVTVAALAFILMSCGTIILSGMAATDTVEYGDLVNVRYWLYLNADYSGSAYDNGTINYVYVSQGTTVPDSIKQRYPDAAATYLEDFKTNLVGMKEGETKRFMIPAERGYNDPRYGELYNKDLFFQVTLLKIVYKGSSGGNGGGSGSQDFFEQNRTLILLGAVGTAGLAGVGIYNWRVISKRQQYERASDEEATSLTVHRSYDKRLDSLKALSSSLEKTKSGRDSSFSRSSKSIKPRSKGLKPRKR